MNVSTRKKTRTVLGAAIVAACALVTSLGIGVGVAYAAPAPRPVQGVISAGVVGCPAGWSRVPVPVVIDRVRLGQCARGGEDGIVLHGGGAGYSRGDGWVRWAGWVSVPAGRHIVTLAGDAHSIAAIDHATLAPSHVDGVQGVRSVILTGPETVHAEVDWSGIRTASLAIKPWSGARH